MNNVDPKIAIAVIANNPSRFLAIFYPNEGEIDCLAEAKQYINYWNLDDVQMCNVAMGDITTLGTIIFK